ncbi:glycoside hydrolase [Apiospora arundinis]
MKPPIALAIATFYVSWVTSRASALDGKAENAAKLLAASIQISTATGPIPGRPTDVESARAAVLAGNYTKNVHFQERDRCPLACSSTAANTSGWYVYGGLQRLHRACEKPMLLDLALSNPIGTDTPHVAVSACTADFESPVGDEGPSDPISATSCGLEGVETSKATSYVQLKKSGPSNSAHVVDVASIVDQLQRFSELTVSGCNETIKFAYFGSVAVGVYSGSGFANRGVLGPVLGALSRQVRSDDNVAEETSAQLCSNSSSRYSLGVMINTKGNLGAVQHALYTWKNSSCIDGGTTVSDWKSVTYHVPSLLLSQYNSSATNNTRGTQRRGVLRQLTIRAEACTTIQVHSGDSCGSLAAQCGISASDFTKYNPSSSLCSGLVEGQHVCCSAGSLPDFTPKPDANGYCHTYFVYAGDSCSSIAAANSITNEKIEEFNRNTWGWNGCAKMFADYNICLSSGFPPMPASIPNAQCGPQVNDTATPPPGTDLSTLNQCPLNACCNIWGQCGTTTEFCTVSKSKTGAPGTAAPGENGCISNCGTTIIASEAPAEPFSIAYFEAFNWQRPCLRMPITKVDTKAYTHIHFSFITLNEDFTINTNGVADQLMLFRGMGDIKKVVSLGGWSFSTEPATYAILRNAVATEANRQALVTNVVNFLNDNRLDGIDWDWEYPDEPDIPGIPAGSEDESTGFFLLLDELKQKMPAGKTVSVTAPASYWYLQHFPIQAISLVVDYLVYMTYDLHGQWDYSNKYASSGCTSYDKGLGNCLRSHVNLTETINSLSMITKAGVPSKMIAVGVSSYGRSFKMETAGCWTEQCTYTGPESGAYKGRCTGTAGYISDFEIGEILAQNPSAQSLYDADSMSNIVVFNQTEWVAYMDKDNKAQRKALFPGINFLGSADWAVDLQSEDGGGDGNGSGGNGGSDQTFYIDPAIWGSLTPRVTVPPGVTLIWPPMPLPTPTTITFPPWTTAVSYSSLTTRTSTGSDGSTSTFPFYVYTTWQTVLTIPPVTTTAIPVWGITLDETSTEGVILLTSSIQPPPFTITVTPVMNGSISVIGASETTTSTPIPIFWGTKTYTPRSSRERKGVAPP